MRTERADINQLMQQMQAMRAQMQPQQVVNPDAIAGDKSLASGMFPVKGVENTFGKVMGQALNQVNNYQQEASSLAQSYELGTEGVDLTRVMIASQKASISFQAALQVRNKLVNAYQEVMNMPI